jgi:hypothetical protein
MTSPNLEGLARRGELKAERISRREFLTLPRGTPPGLRPLVNQPAYAVGQRWHRSA